MNYKSTLKFDPDHVRPSMMIDEEGPTVEVMANTEIKYDPAELTNESLYAALNDFGLTD